jgi:hypothetical protein
VAPQEVFEEYCRARSALKAPTLHDYGRMVFGDPKDGLRRPIDEFSKDAVAVTGGCIMPDAERLRIPIQQITDCLLSAGAMNYPTKIIALQDASVSKFTRSRIA